MRYLVTGGAGFIGSHIVEELLRRNKKARILDNFSTGRRENIACFLENLANHQLPVTNNLEVIEGDIRNFDIVRKAMKGIDYVLHQAALVSVARSIKDPITVNEVNVGGTLNILKAARDAKVKRVVYASSSSIYGNSEILPKKEDMNPEPISPYAVSKLSGEKYCQVFHKVYGLETVILRYFNVFGPRQDPNSQYSAAIPKFISAIKKGKSPIIYGDGLQTRDFTYVSNVVEANILAIETEDTGSEIFNIACGKRYSLLSIIDRLNEILGTSVKPTFKKPKPGDVKHSMADISKSMSKLKYSPRVELLDGLVKTVKWF
ncbi:MAG: SDR family oxidoreductase [bacterium]|nr:SDR family oxidoreductase [bacterium]